MSSGTGDGTGREQLERARDSARRGLRLTRRLDPVDRVLIEPLLFRERVVADGLLEDYEAQSEAIEGFKAVWSELDGQREVQAVLAANPRARGLVYRALAETSGACLGSLRVYDARGFATAALNVAVANGDQDSQAWAHVRSLPVNQMLLDEKSVAESVGWLRAAGGLGAVPRWASFEGVLIGASSLAEAEAWLCRRRGDFAGAAVAFERMAEEGTTRDPVAGQALGNLLALRRAVELVVAGELDSAGAVLAAEDAFGQLDAGERDVALEALLLLAAARDDARRAGECARRYLRKAEQLPLGTGTVGEALAYLAWAAARTGDDDLAVAAARRATTSMVLTSSGRLPVALRMRVQDGQRRVRDMCVSALAAVGTADSAAMILDVLGAWRDQTLRDLTLEHLTELPADMRDALVEIDAQLDALGTAEWRGDEARTKAERALDASREKFTDVAGKDFVLLAAPHPLRPRKSSRPGDAEAWVVATLVTQPTRQIVTVVVDADGTVRSRTVPVDESTSGLLRTLRDGLVTRTGLDVQEFHERWAQVRHRIAHGLGIDLVLDVPGVRRVRLVLDAALENAPVGDLPIDGTGRPLADVVSIAWSEFVPTETPAVATAPSVPSVLAFHFDGAQDEADALRALAREGVVVLTEATSLGEVRARLRGGEAFDALVVSSHGSGTGLGYRFHEVDRPAPGDRDHVLFTHELVGARVPPVVIVASCSSGLGGARDITGLLATLLSNGARQVACAGWEIGAGPTTVAVVSRLVRGMASQPDLARALQDAKSDARAEPWGARFRLAIRIPGPFWWEGLRVVTR